MTTRTFEPLWKRVAKRLRAVAHRGLTVLDHVAPWRQDAFLPPAHLRIYYYRTWKPEAFRRACRDARLELDLAGLRPEHRVLDIGSGIGNLAVGLIGYLEGTTTASKFTGKRWTGVVVRSRLASRHFDFTILT
jgi:hypothetical protein